MKNRGGRTRGQRRGGNPAGKRWTSEAASHVRAAATLRKNGLPLAHRFVRRELCEALKIIARHARNDAVRLDAMLLYERCNPDALP